MTRSDCEPSARDETTADPEPGPERDDLIIAETAIPSGAHKTVRLPVAALPTGTVIDLPVHVLRSSAPGPTLLLQGGLHGDEINGIEILRRMMAEGLCQPSAGTVLVIPVVNVFGFLQHSRDVPGGKDVNRSFPGSKRGSLASRVAWQHTHNLMPHVDIAIDLHTGGSQRHNHPQVRYTASLDRSRELAAAFGAPFSFPSTLIAKSFRHTAAKRDIPVVVYEAGESMRIDEYAVEVGIAGIRRVMAHLGMAEHAPSHDDAVQLTDTTWLRARRSGMFRALVSTGQHVLKGDVLGMITDPFENHRTQVKATKTGFVITVNHQPVVHQGDALLRLGMP